MSQWGPVAESELSASPRSSRARLLIAGGTLAAVVVVGGAGYSLLSHRGPGRQVAHATVSGSPSAASSPSAAPSPSAAASAASGGGGLSPAGYFINPKPPVATIAIPSLGISGQVIPVDLAKDGSMGVTNQSNNMGWWDRGPLPGQPGDSVVGGHLDWYDTPHAIFFNLKNIKQGADIFVKRTDGTSFHFVVYQVRNVAYNARIPDLFDGAGPPRLTLITCGGVFDARSQNYSNRLLVDAHLA
jgi:sortase (surface protein transpeptidase)